MTDGAVNPEDSKPMILFTAMTQLDGATRAGTVKDAKAYLEKLNPVAALEIVVANMGALRQQLLTEISDLSREGEVVGPRFARFWQSCLHNWQEVEAKVYDAVEDVGGVIASLENLLRLAEQSEAELLEEHPLIDREAESGDADQREEWRDDGSARTLLDGTVRAGTVNEAAECRQRPNPIAALQTADDTLNQLRIALADIRQEREKTDAKVYAVLADMSSIVATCRNLCRNATKSEATIADEEWCDDGETRPAPSGERMTMAEWDKHFAELSAIGNAELSVFEYLACTLLSYGERLLQTGCDTTNLSIMLNRLVTTNEWRQAAPFMK